MGQRISAIVGTTTSSVVTSFESKTTLTIREQFGTGRLAGTLSVQKQTSTNRTALFLDAGTANFDLINEQEF